MSEKPPTTKPPLGIPRRGDPVTRLEPIAAVMRRVMALEKQVWGGKPVPWEPPIMAKITGRSTAGGVGVGYEYTAVEVYWKAGTWIEQTGGVDYSNTGIGDVYEIRQNVSVPIDAIVQLFQIEAGSAGLPAGDNRVTRWVFEYAEHPVYMPFKVDRASSNRVVVGLNRGGLAQNGDIIDGREMHDQNKSGWGFGIVKGNPEYKTITEDSWLYYHINMINETASLETTDLIINQLGSTQSEIRNVPLAYIKWNAANSEIESIQQLHFGRMWLEWWFDPASLAECSINHQGSFLELINDQSITELDATGAAWLAYAFKDDGNVRGWHDAADLLGDYSLSDLGPSSLADLSNFTNTRRT